MSVLALSFPAPQSRTEWVGIGAVAGLAASMQFSIAAAQILLGLAVVAWLVRLRAEHRTFEAPSFFWPLAAYGVATLVSAGFSTNPAVSVVDTKQLFLFLIVPVVYDFARGRRADLLLSLIISVGAASALVGVVQYGVLNYDNLGRRMQGTLSHWMTYSGTLMLVICATIARLLFGTRDRLWSAFVLPALVISLALTLTRGAWVGAAAGAAVLFLVKDFRLTALIPVTVAVALLVLATLGIVAPVIPWARIFRVTSSLAIRETGPSVLIFLVCFLVNLPLGIVEKVRIGYQEGFANTLWQVVGSVAGLLLVLLVWLSKLLRPSFVKKSLASPGLA